MAVLQDININVHGQPSEKRLQTFLRLSQNENGRMINFRVLGAPLPSNCTATFSGTKPDGNVYSKTGTVTGNFVVIEEDIQMTAVAGVWDAKLDIINGAHNIMTALIRVVVDADVVDPDAIASDSQLQGLVAEAKYYAEHARTDAYGSPLTAPTKAQMTDHTRVYVYTGSEPNMVAGNWYLWNGSAWVSGGVYNAVAVQTDTTLSVAGKAADAKKTGDEISSLKEDLNAEYVGKRRSLTANDDVFALPVGVYFIVASSESKPSNLPSEFVSTHNGCLVVLEGDSSTARTAFVMDAYSRRIWFRSAYEWVEIVKTDTANALIADAVNGVYISLNNNLFPDFTNIAQDFYAPSSEVSTTKTQFKFLGSSGVVDVATTYTDWYVTDEIDVTQFTFYFITASARYAGHYLYAFYDANGNILSYEGATGSTAVSINKKLVYAPPNASKLRIATITGASGASLYSAQEKSVGKKWAGLKWACMGDSLTAVNIRTTKHYHDYIAGKTGITVVNLGAGGTGYKQSYAGVSGFMDRVDTIPLDADVVTIFGSGNDHSYTVGDPEDTGTDTLCGCINTTISRIFERITTCQLGIVTPTPWQAYNPADDTNWMARYSAAIVQICKNWGIPCLDLYHCSNLRPWDADFRAAAYSKDDGGGTHPDETGHALIAPRFEAFLDELLMH